MYSTASTRKGGTRRPAGRPAAEAPQHAPDAARLTSTLIRSRRATSVLEIGTSSGYSAIWFADALRDTGGRLTTVDVDADRATAAPANLERAGVREYADVRHGDGAEILADTPDAS
ncbi:O-methyltransferase [Streptomyces sp. NPDC002172]